MKKGYIAVMLLGAIFLLAGTALSVYRTVNVTSTLYYPNQVLDFYPYQELGLILIIFGSLFMGLSLEGMKQRYVGLYLLILGVFLPVIGMAVYGRNVAVNFTINYPYQTVGWMVIGAGILSFGLGFSLEWKKAHQQ